MLIADRWDDKAAATLNQGLPNSALAITHLVDLVGI